ncbi:hypothetical protein GCM10011607_28850 [Shewanella inventionis]|uniref:Conjugal transfer protein TraD n=1 Tax=Shewanella inventionis TaxID=1738770 RepID=A0ABQ1JG96_9GAMM|nr:hypothetical protein [Shewanella inventionis]GGB66454.1 hypothetical protein GCM10011607_28850 [Shewanella inventionis]
MVEIIEETLKDVQLDGNHKQLSVEDEFTLSCSDEVVQGEVDLVESQKYLTLEQAECLDNVSLKQEPVDEHY